MSERLFKLAQVFNELNTWAESGIWQVGSLMPVWPPAYSRRTPPHPSAPRPTLHRAASARWWSRAAHAGGSGGTAQARCVGSGFRSRRLSSAAASAFSNRADALVVAQSLASAGSGLPSAPRVPCRRSSAPRSGPLPREDGCCTPGPQLLPLPGALLRPRTLLSPAAAPRQE